MRGLVLVCDEWILLVVRDGALLLNGLAHHAVLRLIQFP